MGCIVGHCEKKVLARGYCTHHYYAWRKYGDPLVVKLKQHHGKTLAERVALYTKKTEGCWPWLSYKDPNGYGRLHIEGRPVLANRISYLLHYGDIPAGMTVCHKCDNPSCVNPAHLFLGTQADNVADMHGKGRARKRGLKGEAHNQAKLTEAAVRAIRTSDLTEVQLAKRYGVSNATIHSAKSGRTWKHVKGD